MNIFDYFIILCQEKKPHSTDEKFSHFSTDGQFCRIYFFRILILYECGSENIQCFGHWYYK